VDAVLTSESLPVPLITAHSVGKVVINGDRLFIERQEVEMEEHIIPSSLSLLVKPGDKVKAGEPVTGGQLNPHDILRIKGRKALERHLVDEVQKVYRSQGVTINDKHIEVIVRQMLLRVQVDSLGDTELLPGEFVNRFKFEEINAKTIAEGREPATAKPILSGITRASLNTDSFLSAASFQEATRVLAEAALEGKVDHLTGLKENVIIGRTIPARCLPEEIEEQEVELPQLSLQPSADSVQ
jgi:DNA-directed RNA polymerase subunit beta'